MQKTNFKAQKRGKPNILGNFARRATSPKPPMTDLYTLAGSKMAQHERNYEPKVSKFREAIVNCLRAMHEKPEGGL